MPTIQRPRLLKTDVLREMKPSSIANLLSPHADYFTSRGIDLTDVGEDGFDFSRLALVLASANELTPPVLVEHLDMLDLISSDQCFLNFENQYHEVLNRIKESDDTPADVAVKILLEAPDLAYREYDRQAVRAERSMVSFRVREGARFMGVNERRIELFKETVGPWFEENSRSATCRFSHLEEGDGHAFVINHGDLLKRLGVLDAEGNQESQVFRPEKIDIAHFHPLTGEWQVSGLGTKLQDLYRRAFGLAFYGSETALMPSKRYSLEPLRDGPESIRCDMMATVQHAELKKLAVTTPDGQDIIISKGMIFEGLNFMNSRFLQAVHLREATISLKLANRKRRVSVRICPDRDTIIGNAADPAIDAWLRERQFANDDGRLLASA